MKFVAIASKGGKELLRDHRGFIMILIFPLLFMLVFGFAFGGMGQANQPHDIAVINYDQGATLPISGERLDLGSNFTHVLEDVKYEDSEVKIFVVRGTDLNEANCLLRQKTVDAVVIIPENFTESILDSTGGGTTPTPVVIRGDTGYMGFGVSQGILVGIIEQYQDELSAQLSSQFTGKTVQPVPKLIETRVESIPGTETFTSFDYMAPGMIVFALLLLATTVATTLAREVEKGTLSRLKLSRMKSFDFLLGNLIPWSLVAVAQVLILLGVAVLMGFNWQGGLNSIFLAVLVGIIGGVASVSLGMIIASFVWNDHQAATLGTIITVPTSFLVGAFFPLPQVVLGEVMDQQFQVYDILPWHHVLNALRSILTFGGGWNDIAQQVGWAVLLTTILFTGGVFIFARTRLRPDKQ